MDVDDTTALDATGDHMKVRILAGSTPPGALWRLLATPRHWPSWAPHIRRVSVARDRDDGAPLTSVAARGRRDASGDHGRAHGDAVTVGERVRIDSVWPVHVTARITLVDPERRWDFAVDLPVGHQLVSTHEVEIDPRAVVVGMRVSGPATPDPIGPVLLAAYRPVAHLALQRLVRLAAQTDADGRTGA